MGMRPSVEALIEIRDLGAISYGEGMRIQRELHEDVVAARARPEPAALHLLLLEHDPPVVTVRARADGRRYLQATAAELAAAGVELAETDRGGDITYHGPGQLVVYPVLDLNVLRLRVRSYVQLLEQIVTDVLDQYGIEGKRDPAATGVWVASKGREPAKICAIGVRISRWVSMHGFALNVTTDLRHFDLIVPCGLADRSVTSMQRELGDRCPSMDDVKRAVADRFTEAVRERTV